MSKKSFIDSVEVTSPCTKNWNEMEGNDRVRFCTHCSKHVNNLSEMTRKEAMRFVRSSEGRICVRYIPDPVTKRPMFAEQLLQMTRRAPGLAAGVMTASMSISTAAYAQEAAPADQALKTETVARQEKLAEPISKDDKTPRLAKLSGTVLDPNGAVIPGASIVLTSVNGTRTATTNDEGFYSFDSLESGNYQMETSSPGFKKNQIQVAVERSEAVEDQSLEVGGFEVTVDVHADVAMDVGAVGGVMVSVEYTSDLSRAIANDDIDAVRELIVKGANVNAKEDSYSKITPLYIAVEHGNIDMVGLLLDSGAKVNRRDESRRTPLMRIDSDTTRELVDLLIRHGAKVDLADEDGDTALFYAASAYEMKPEAVQSLIDNGASVNFKNKKGETPLMQAVSSGNLEVVRVLLLAGAEVNVKDNEGDTALDRASDEEDGSELRELLISNGAESAKPATAPIKDN